jgi:hypothetical protein
MGFRNRHEAAALSYDICKCAHEIDRKFAGEVSEEFRARARELSSEDILDSHIEYVVTLATAKRKLLYEELHKVFSLSDEIEALRFMGYEIDPRRLEQLNAALRALFARDAVRVRMVAEDRYEPWKSDWWWYRVNLKRD